ncbi:MAG: nucleotidyltransferase domain-containing protein [Solirubrobacteraceae bacterium]
MGRALAETARELDCSERTLRRYINDGLLRGRRLNRLRFELPAQEQLYARSHWALLHGLRTALRTERDVRLAVLFGSTSTGEEAPDSDIDLLVVYRGEDELALAALRRRLSGALGRRLHLVRLEDASRSANLLADTLAEGRVIIDRDGLWPAVRDERERIAEMAKEEDEQALAGARAAVDAARKRLEL